MLRDIIIYLLNTQGNIIIIFYKMGCGGSKEFNAVYTDYPKLKIHQEAFEKIGLTEKEVGKFYEKFLQYKIDGK